MYNNRIFSETRTWILGVKPLVTAPTLEGAQKLCFNFQIDGS